MDSPPTHPRRHRGSHAIQNFSRYDVTLSRMYHRALRTLIWTAASIASRAFLTSSEATDPTLRLRFAIRTDCI